METLKNSFKHDYDLAVVNFNQQDYVAFFRNIRPAIELICKLIIRDVINSKTDYDDIMQGRKTIRKSIDKYILSQDSRRGPVGSALTTLFPKVYYYKNPNVYEARYDNNLKRKKSGLDSSSANLNYWYSIASEFGSHAGDSAMDIETQARSCAAIISSFIDFLCADQIVSKETVNFFEQLQKFTFSSVNEQELDDAKNRIKETEEKIQEQDRTISEQEANLLIMKKQLAESEKAVLESKEQTSTVEKQLQEKILELEELKLQMKEQNVSDVIEEVIEEPIIQKIDSDQSQSKGNLKKILATNGWDVEEDKMDDDQLELIEDTMDQSMLVAGCAGSGKSVIAMHKARQIAEAGYEVILIAYTKSLNGFMQTGCTENINYRFFYHYQWVQCEKPSADYIIVDEIQDFDKKEIMEFINAAKKHFLFFGDTAQSIFRKYGRKTLTIEEISELTNLPVLLLYNNYRLPRPVAKITQNYVGVGVSPYADKNYKNEEKSLPRFVYIKDFLSQMQAIKTIIDSNSESTIGILLPSNSLVIDTYKELGRLGIKFEYKFQADLNEKKVIGNLNFTTKLPKLMTYHSAKGLQFDIVILPKYEGANDDDSKKALYVAMTRTLHKLYILYSTPELLPPLKDVPSHLYKKEIQ
jgi:hypothetical protein